MALYYYGFISDWSVQVTQWTQFMIPMRCVINIDFTLLPTTATASGTPGRAWTEKLVEREPADQLNRTGKPARSRRRSRSGGIRG